MPRSEEAWTASTTIVEVSPGHRVLYVHRGAEIIAQVWMPESGDAEHLAYLARLIAKAPLLLAFTEGIARLGTRHFTEPQEIRDEARALLAEIGEEA